MTLTFTSAEDCADTGALLARVVRLDPAALVRLQTVEEAVLLWAWLPLEVLVSRSVRGVGPRDVTVSAKSLLEALTAPLAASGAAPPSPPNRTIGISVHSSDPGVRQNPDSSSALTVVPAP